MRRFPDARDGNKPRIFVSPLFELSVDDARVVVLRESEIADGRPCSVRGNRRVNLGVQVIHCNSIRDILHVVNDSKGG